MPNDLAFIVVSHISLSLPLHLKIVTLLPRKMSPPIVIHANSPTPRERDSALRPSSRSSSIASLITIPDDADDDTIQQAQDMANLVSKGRDCLTNISKAINNKKAPSTKLVTSLRNILDAVEKRDKLIQETIHNLNTDKAILQEKCSHQRETITHLKEDNNRFLTSIPSVEHISAALKDVLTEQATKATLLAMTEPVVAPTPAPSYIVRRQPVHL